MRHILILLILITSFSCNNIQNESNENAHEHEYRSQDSFMRTFIHPDIKHAINKYNLDNLDAGFNIFEIRLWYTKGKYPNTRLFIIKKDSLNTISFNNFLLPNKNDLLNPQISTYSTTSFQPEEERELERYIIRYKLLEYPKFFEYKVSPMTKIHGSGYFIEIAMPGNYIHYYYSDLEKIIGSYEHLNLLHEFINYLDAKYGFYNLKR